MRTNRLLARPLQSEQDHIEGFDALLRRWGIRDDDLDAKAVGQRLAKTWRAWPRRTRAFLVRAVEAIAAAEAAKGQWNPKQTRRAHRRIAELSRAAGQLAEGIGEVFPADGDGHDADVRQLYGLLVNFARAGLWSTVFSGRDHALVTASTALAVLKKQMPKHSGRLSSPLLRDLVWLAGQKRTRPDETTIRRYSRISIPAPSPVKQFWKRYYRSLAVFARVPESGFAFPFEKPIRDFLEHQTSSKANRR
jgi:hypothetical protein